MIKGYTSEFQDIFDDVIGRLKKAYEMPVDHEGPCRAFLADAEQRYKENAKARGYEYTSNAKAYFNVVARHWYRMMTRGPP